MIELTRLFFLSLTHMEHFKLYTICFTQEVIFREVAFQKGKMSSFYVFI